MNTTTTHNLIGNILSTPSATKNSLILKYVTKNDKDSKRGLMKIVKSHEKHAKKREFMYCIEEVKGT